MTFAFYVDFHIRTDILVVQYKTWLFKSKVGSTRKGVVKLMHLTSSEIRLPKVAALVLVGICVAVTSFSGGVLAADKDVAFKIGGKVTTIDQLMKDDQAAFYELEDKKFKLVEQIANDRYLEFFWQQKAKQTNASVEAARRTYLEKNSTISEKETNETLDKFKDHPQLKKLEKPEQLRQVREYLKDKSEREVLDGIIRSGQQKGELVVSYPRPQEPIYDVSISDSDYVRFGPEASDTKPAGCSKNDCAITVVEYSEYQCPFCEKVMPDVKRILAEYKGKIRWSVRDFPLSFHDRARPAAVAAKCAGDQGKYWDMHLMLFANQQALGDSDLKGYGSKLGLDKGKFETCFNNPAPKNEIIEKNIQSGMKVGVSGTPAFFINGRRLSGAMPYSEFKRVIDEELKRGKRS